jgi:hypothetical protein
VHYVISWIALPLLVAGASLGVGLLVEQLTGLRFSNGVTFTVGFVASFVALALPYELGRGAAWGAALLVLLTVAGFVVARDRLSAALPDGPTALAALAVYGLYMAPIVLSGQTSFAGYTLLGDTSVHFSMVDYISDHGARLVSQAPSSFSSVTSSEITIGYPLGLHYELASVRWLLGAEVSRIYQPFLATTIALAVFPVTRLLRKVGATRGLSAIAALIVLAAYLPYSYSLQGGIKELGMITLVLLGGLLAWELVAARRPVALAIVYGIVTAGAFEIYSYGGLPWFGLIGLAAVGALLFAGRNTLRSALTIGAAAVAGFAVAALPVIPDSLDFFSQGNRLLTSSTGSDVGNLLGPIKLREAFGVWLVDDFRLPTHHERLTYTLVGVVVLLAVLGAVWSIRRGQWGPLVIAASALLVWIILPAGIYIEAKLLTILSVTIVLLALVGGWSLFSEGHRAGAALLVLAAAIGILVSDAMAYHGLYLAPTKRLDELRTIDDRFKGQGVAMLNEFEEYGKHYLRDLPPVVPYDAWTPVGPSLRNPALPVYAHYYDLDEMTVAYVEQFPLLILRRSPVASRPPANYRRAFVGRYYEVWRRTGGPKVTVHLSLGDADDPAADPRCAEVRDLARTAGAGARLAAAERAAPIALPVRAMKPPPPNWAVTPDKRVAPTGPGRMGVDFNSGGGRYEVWFRGSFGRGAKVYVDGRYAGRALSVQTPQQMARVGGVSLSRGNHRLEIKRDSGGLAPGNGQDEVYDTVFLAPDAQARLVDFPRAEARSLCGRHLDWVEVVP